MIEREGLRAPVVETLRTFRSVTHGFGASARDDLDAVSGPLALGTEGASLIERTLGALGLAAFVCDGLARVRGLTPAARCALEAGRIRLLNGRVSAPQHYDCGDMESAIAAATSLDDAPVEPRARTVVNRNRREPGAVQIIDVITLPRQRLTSRLEPRAVVVMRGGSNPSAELKGVLVRAFDLTPAEAEVAASLSGGMRREAIAASRGASLQTVRSQIKSIFGKLGVTRERELVSMLAGIMQR
jgi:DNA-binding CsgD family transcriptional regulator